MLVNEISRKSLFRSCFKFFRWLGHISASGRNLLKSTGRCITSIMKLPRSTKFFLTKQTVTTPRHISRETEAPLNKQ